MRISLDEDCAVSWMSELWFADMSFKGKAKTNLMLIFYPEIGSFDPVALNGCFSGIMSGTYLFRLCLTDDLCLIGMAHHVHAFDEESIRID